MLLAAGALAAMPVASPAAVIYSGIRNLSATSSNTVDLDQAIGVDVNGDSTLDLHLFLGATVALGAGSSGGQGDGSGFYLQSMGSGQSIGPIGGNWKLSGILAAVGSNPVPVEGPWAPPNQTGTFGFAFNDSSALYYGWARANVDFDLTAVTGTATLIDWAYENQPDTSIHTPVPEPSTLSLLALGAAGLAAVRARRNRA